MKARSESMRRGRRVAGAAVLLLGLCIPLFTAHAEERLHLVEFQVQVEREVQNDLIRAVLAVERENVDAARLAQDVNQIMARALGEAREQAGVRVRSGNYRTWPVQEQRRIVRWRAEQEMILEGEEPESLHRLIGALQDRLLLRGISYTVSPQQGRELEQALTAEALEAFKARADLVVEGLGAAGYDVVRLRINGGGMQPPVPMMMSRTMAMAEDAAVAGEPGTSRLGTAVHAVIQLRY